MTFPEYHFCILGDGTVKQTLSIKEKGAHTWKRNTGNVGISMCAMAPGFPVKDVQIEACAKLVAELCQIYGLSILKDVYDHAYWARKDFYFPDRWDIGDKFPIVIRKARWYYAKLLLPKLLGGIDNSLKGKLV
jgi:hypothetical protein